MIAVAIMAVVGTVHAAHVFTFGVDGSQEAQLNIYGNASTEGGRVVFLNGNSYDGSIDYWHVGIHNYHHGDYLIRGVGPSGTFDVFRIVDTTRLTIMEYDLQLEGDLTLGTDGASITTDGGDIVFELGS